MSVLRLYSFRLHPEDQHKNAHALVPKHERFPMLSVHLHAQLPVLLCRVTGAVYAQLTD